MMKFSTTLKRRSLVLAGLLAGVGADAQTTFTWTSGSGTDFLWSNYPNWDVGSPGVFPGSQEPMDAVQFGTSATVSAAGTVNNVVDQSTTVASLTYGQSTGGQWHVTQIPAGTTLTVGNLTIGGSSTSSVVTDVAMTGAGTLLVTGSLAVGNPASASPANQGTLLDLSGLSNFVFSAAGGSVVLGAPSSANSRCGGNMNFAAASNFVSAATISLTSASGSSTVSATTNLVNLGSGTNLLNGTTINFGLSRVSGVLRFPGATGGLRVRGVSGADTDRANFIIGNLNYNGGSSALAVTSSVALFGHPVDMKLGTLTIAKNYNSSFAGTSAIEAATLSFDNGTVDATTIALAGTDANAKDTAVGVLNVSTNGVLIAGTGGITLSRLGSGAGPANGALNLTNATLYSSNSIVRTTGGTGTVAIVRSKVTLTAGVLGTPALPINALVMGDSTLSLALPLNGTGVVASAFSNPGATGNTINILSFPTIAHYPTTFPVLSFASGTAGTFTLGTLPAASPAYAGFLTTTATGVNFVLTGGPAPAVQTLTWNGSPSGDWDFLTANWQGGLFYNQNDYVTFNDTAKGATNVSLATVLAPGFLTVSNQALSYTFTGSGLIGGNAALNKYGTGSMVLGNATNNTFSGGLNISGGVVRLTNLDNLLPTNGTVGLANVAGATLDLNNLNQRLGGLVGGGAAGGGVTLGAGGTNTLTLAGGGAYYGTISGNGAVAVVNGAAPTFYGANTYTNGTTITGAQLSVANATGSATGPGPVTIAGGGTLQIGDGTLAGRLAAPTIDVGGTLSFNAAQDFVFANLFSGIGALNKNNTNTVTVPGPNPDFQGPVTINGGTLLVTDSSALGLSNGRILTLGADPSAALALVGGVTITAPLNIYAKNFGSGASASVVGLGGTNTLAGFAFLSQFGSDWVFQSTAGRLVIANVQNGASTGNKNLWLVGNGDGEWDSGLTEGGGSVVTSLIKSGAGTWTLANQIFGYTGGTTISNGTLVVNGTIGNSSAVNVAGGTLAGNGTIFAPVTVKPAGAISPGYASIDTLTVNSDLTLAGTTVMDVSAVGGVVSNDQLVVAGNLTLGGVLQMNLSGALVGGEVFPLFSSGSFAGGFSTLQLPALPAGLAWDTTNLAVNGNLAVLAVAVTPPALGWSPATGGGLSFTWPGSFKLQAQTNSLSTGLGTNWFDYPGGGASGVTVPVDAASPAVFFRLISK